MLLSILIVLQRSVIMEALHSQEGNATGNAHLHLRLPLNPLLVQP